MTARARSFVLVGLDAVPVEVEARVNALGAAGFAIVGLPDKAVSEARERVRAGVISSGLGWTEGRVTVNLAPAAVRKEGSGFDLAIALAVLACLGGVEQAALDRVAVLGELALDGRLRAARGGLAAAEATRRLGLAALLAPPGAAQEAALVDGVAALPVRSLRQAVDLLRGLIEVEPARPVPSAAADVAMDDGDLADVRGQDAARRALEIAAAGAHNLLFVGPPGVGKSMLARRLPTILPPLEPYERLDVLRIRSAAGLGLDGAALRRPFRAPHHSASAAALVGGGPLLAPGEATLATHGVLFLDELPEFRRDALEALRAPVEEGRVRIVRAAARVDYPARFALVAAMNPCPCGAPDAAGCTCGPARAEAYRRRVSGPLLDRIDLGVRLARPEARSLRGPGGEGSGPVAARVALARARQAARGAGPNAALRTGELRRLVVLDEAGERLVERAIDRLRLSPRGVDRALRVARTVADLAGADDVAAPHVAEALALRIGALA